MREMDLSSGDKLVITAGGVKVWTVSAVNNRVVKYFDENNRYGQIPLAHLEAMLQNGQAEIVRTCKRI